MKHLTLNFVDFFCGYYLVAQCDKLQVFRKASQCLSHFLGDF